MVDYTQLALAAQKYTKITPHTSHVYQLFDHWLCSWPVHSTSVKATFFPMQKTYTMTLRHSLPQANARMFSSNVPCLLQYLFLNYLVCT